MKRTMLGAVAVFALLTVPVRAGMIGDSVDVQLQSTTAGSEDGGNTTVGGSVEYPIGSFPTYGPCWSVDITNTQIIIEWNGSPTSLGPIACGGSGAGSFPGPPAETFNGFEIILNTGGQFLSAVADPSSVFNPVITLSGNDLFLNYAGTTGITQGEESIIDVITAPEPASLPLMGAGLTGLYFVRRRKAASRQI